MRMIKFPINRYCTICKRVFSVPKNKTMHDESKHGIEQDKYVRVRNIITRAKSRD